MRMRDVEDSFVFDALCFTVDGDFHMVCVMPCFNGHFGITGLRVNNWSNFETGCTVFDQFKVFIRYGNDAYFPVQAAIEGKVCLLRIDAVTVRIVYCNGKCICFLDIC